MSDKELERMEKVREAAAIICQMTDADAAKECAIINFAGTAYALGAQSVKPE